jgi:hypothetical protein
MSPSIIGRDNAEQNCSLFNLKAFGINNIGPVIDESKISKLNSKGLTNEKWGSTLNILSS